MKASDYLKAFMDTNKITQTTLATEADVSQTTIVRMMKGSQNLNWKVLKVLRNKYKADINKFLDC